jgi:hypothetical protein
MMNIHVNALKVLVALGIMLPGLSSSASAHQDTSLKVSENKIVGLPEKYGPCLIDFEQNQLSIRGEGLKLPDFLEDVLKSKRRISDEGKVLFEAGVLWRLEITASWYHDKSDEGSLPDYMLLEFYPHNKDYHFKVFVNLEKPMVVGSEIFLTTFSKDDGDSWISSAGEQPKGLVSTQMSLVIDESTKSVMDRLENRGPSKKQDE